MYELVLIFICFSISLGIVLYLSQNGFTSIEFLFFLHLFLGINLRYLILFKTENYTLYALHPLVNLKIITLIEMNGFLFITFLCFIVIKPYFKSVRFYVFPSVKVECSYHYFKYVCFLFFIVYFLYLFLMMSAVGGFEQLLYVFQVRVSSHLAGLGYIGILSDFAVLLSLYIYLMYSNNEINRFRIKIFTCIVLLTAVANLIFQGGRGNLIMYLISLCIISLLSKGRTKLKVSNGLVILIVVVGVTIVGLTARMSAQRDIQFDQALNNVNAEVVGSVSAPFALYDHYYISKLYSDINGHDFGAFYLSNLLRPIPRSLWEDKPEVLGKKIRLQFWGDDQGGIPPGLIGEAYISFSLFGLVVVGIFSSYLLSYISALYTFSVINKSYILTCSVLIPYLAFNLVRGGIDVAFTRVVIFLFLLYMLALISKVFNLDES